MSCAVGILSEKSLWTCSLVERVRVRVFTFVRNRWAADMRSTACMVPVPQPKHVLPRRGGDRGALGEQAGNKLEGCERRR